MLPPLRRSRSNARPRARAPAVISVSRRTVGHSPPASPPQAAPLRTSTRALARPPGVEVSASHILFKDAATAEANAAAALEQLAAGADFSALAAEKSACPSGARGGNLGWFGRGRMVPEFDAACFDADDTSVGPESPIVTVRTQFGVHLLRVDAQRSVPTMARMPAADLAVELAARDERLALGLDIEGDVAGTVYVDVREEAEHARASVPAFSLKPLSTFQQWGPAFLEETPEDARIVILCHHGMRSAQLGTHLVAQGFTGVVNVEGGIDALAQADQKTPRY